MAENYSLWIKPKGHLYELLQQEIASQAKEFTGPMFEPHVTLLPDIQGDKEQIMSTSQQLAEKLKVFNVANCSSCAGRCGWTLQHCGHPGWMQVHV